MPQPRAGYGHLVRVITDVLEYQIWVAVTSREEAVERVLECVPQGSNKAGRDAGAAGLSSSLTAWRQSSGVARPFVLLLSNAIASPMRFHPIAAFGLAASASSDNAG